MTNYQAKINSRGERDTFWDGARGESCIKKGKSGALISIFEERE